MSIELAHAAALNSTLTSLPSCAQFVASAVASQLCEDSLTCVCENMKFIYVLESYIAKFEACNATETRKAVEKFVGTCTTEFPHLLDDKGWQLQILLSIIAALVILANVGRFWGRYIAAAKFGWDDWLILPATALCLLLNFINLFPLLNNGNGKHEIVVTPEQSMISGKWFFAVEFIFCFIITLTKVSILLLYRRIFPSKRMKMLVNFGLVLMGAWLLQAVLLVALACTPVAYNWDHSLDGHCSIDLNALLYSSMGTNLATDLFVFILPLPELWGLKMKQSRKIGLILTFMLGAFVCVAGLMRIPFILEFNVFDSGWTMFPLGIWMNIETNFGVICACLPPMTPLIAKAKPGFLSVWSSVTKSSRGGSSLGTGYSGYSGDKSGISPSSYKSGSTTKSSATDGFVELKPLNSAEEGRRGY